MRYVRALRRLKDILGSLGDWAGATDHERHRSPGPTCSTCWPTSSPSGTAAASGRRLTEYADKYPELADQIRELFPALVAIEELGSDADPATGPARAPEAAAPIPDAAGRLPHPPRDRPRRHGHRLRGGAGEPGPARGAEGAAAPPTWRPQPARAVPARGPGGGRCCTTPTSCRSSASASTRACTTTPCSSSRARAWTPCSRGQAAARRQAERSPATLDVPGRPGLAASVAIELVSGPVRGPGRRPRRRRSP